MHWFLLPLIFIFCFSCVGSESPYPDNSLQGSVAHVQAETSYRTKHIRKQQRDIRDRLKKIRKRLEKEKGHKKIMEKRLYGN